MQGLCRIGASVDFQSIGLLLDRLDRQEIVRDDLRTGGPRLEHDQNSLMRFHFETQLSARGDGSKAVQGMNLARAGVPNLRPALAAYCDVDFSRLGLSIDKIIDVLVSDLLMRVSQVRRRRGNVGMNCGPNGFHDVGIGGADENCPSAGIVATLDDGFAATRIVAQKFLPNLLQIGIVATRLGGGSRRLSEDHERAAVGDELLEMGHRVGANRRHRRQHDHRKRESSDVDLAGLGRRFGQTRFIDKVEVQ
jgi:hypothetical protein